MWNKGNIRHIPQIIGIAIQVSDVPSKPPWTIDDINDIMDAMSNPQKKMLTKL